MFSPSPDPASAPPGIPPRFTVQARLRSFVFAFRGIGILIRSQHNARIHAVATLGVGAAGFAFGISGIEWCAILLAIALVWTAEALNTALEFLADEVSAARRPLIGMAKDVGAGAVLLSSLGAAAVGAIIFGPRLWHWL
jgi:diacylglycerol kinase